ncbi:MAG: hypothetical protein Q8O45_04090 [Desulfurivibrionaceae bacterium]|nr:hypothetical protein [Desulfurivibrionaceae bacterium]
MAEHHHLFDHRSLRVFYRPPHPPPAWRKQNRLRVLMQRMRQHTRKNKELQDKASRALALRP